MRHHFAIAAALLMLAPLTLNAQDKPKGTDTKMADAPKKDQKEIMVIETSMGTIEVALFRAEAPKTVENFVKLAEKGYYNNLTYHRVMAGFMIQGGDPLGNGTGGESIYGAGFEDEISPKLVFDRPGLLAMANRGKGTKSNGSQYFITVAPTTWLNGNHTIFGEVVAGMDVVYAISKVPTTKPADKPVKPVTMTKVYLKGSKAAESAPKK